MIKKIIIFGFIASFATVFKDIFGDLILILLMLTVYALILTSIYYLFIRPTWCVIKTAKIKKEQIYSKKLLLLFFGFLLGLFVDFSIYLSQPTASHGHFTRYGQHFSDFYLYFTCLLICIVFVLFTVLQRKKKYYVVIKCIVTGYHAAIFICLFSSFLAYLLKWDVFLDIFLDIFITFNQAQTETVYELRYHILRCSLSIDANMNHLVCIAAQGIASMIYLRNFRITR